MVVISAIKNPRKLRAETFLTNFIINLPLISSYDTQSQV